MDPLADRRRPDHEVAPELASQLLQAVGQAVVATDLEGTVVYWNGAAERLYGWSVAEALGRPMLELLTPFSADTDDRSPREYYESVLGGRRRTIEMQIETKSGDRPWIRTNHSAITDGDGRAVGVIGISYDISARRASERELQSSHTRFSALVQRSTDVAVIVALDGTLKFVSPGVVALLGFTPQELEGTSGWDLVHPDDLDALRVELGEVARKPGEHLTTEYRIRTATGDYRWVEETITSMIDEPAVDGLVANIRNITDRKRIEADLNHRVLHDELTGLPNRTHLELALTDALAETSGAAVLVFDIDQFKLINDSHGHGAGDDLLIQVAARLRDSLRPGDLAGRFGGDEFVVVCREVSDTTQGELIAERLQAMFRPPFKLTGVGSVFVTASVGIATAPNGSSSAELFHDADAAMYQAKRSGRARHAIYDDAMRAHAAWRLRVESDLRRALDAGEIIAYYQPIVDVEHGTIVGAEALARWRHPTRGLLGPAEFIPVAEETGMIIELDRRILALALAASSRWSALGHEMHVAVNLSSHQLNAPDLVALVATGIATTATLPGRLSLEVTETAVMTDPKRSIEVVQELATMGVHLALDDFGTGYSSLAYLKQLPVTTVKVDRGFVAGVHLRPDDRDIVAAIIHLARAFGRYLVAEGVETRAQLDALRELGCTMAQGFYWSKPVEEEEMTRLLHDGLEPGDHPGD